MGLKQISFLVLLFIIFSSSGQAQGSLLDMIEENEEETVNYTFATFKTSRVINGHSIETQAQGVMQFMISHRFGRLNSGWRELFGLDNSTIRFGFEYGIFDDLTVGFGRASFEKIYDGYVKYKFLKQSTGAKKMPLSIAAVAGMSIISAEWSEPDRPNFLSSKLNYNFQLLIARKFNEYFSFQLSPTWTHKNLVPTIEDKNDIFSLGFGGRMKVTGSLAINAEYFYTPPGQFVSTVNGENITNAFSIGIDLETGGHVFQIHLTNSRGMAEKHFVTETTGQWLDGDIHLGFNISRVFTIYDPMKKKEKKAQKKLEKAQKVKNEQGE